MSATRKPAALKKGFLGGLLALALVVGAWLVLSQGADKDTAKDTAAVRLAASDVDEAEIGPMEPVGDDDPPLHEGAAGGTATVWVEVVSTDGDPIVGATVTLRSAVAAPEQRSDEAGLATFEGLWPGPYSVDVTATGFAPLSAREQLRAGLPEAAWTFRLSAVGEAAAGVRGVVRSAGVPVAGALVAFMGAGSTLPDGAVLSSGDGRFLLPRLDDADGVIAYHQAHGIVQRSLTGEGEIVLELPAPGFLEGRVVDDRGRPLAAFQVQALTSGLPRGFVRALALASGEKPRRSSSVERHLKTAWTSFPSGADAEVPGSFRVGPLPAGLVRVVASADRRAPAEREVTVKPGAVTSGIELRLQGPVVVTGCVTDARTGAPIKDARVQALRTSSPNAPGFGDAKTGADGCYTLLTTAGLRHSVGVRARGYVSESAGGLFGRADDEVRRDFALQRARGGRQDAFRYVGIGAKLTVHDDGAQVAGVFQSGSAAGALKEGDIILRVDGVWTEGMTLPRIVEMIVGEPDTDVELLVQPKGGGPSETVILSRQPMSSSG